MEVSDPFPSGRASKKDFPFSVFPCFDATALQKQSETRHVYYLTGDVDAALFPFDPVGFYLEAPNNTA